MIYEATNDTRKSIATLFEGSNNKILLSYIQGHMGTAWVDDLDNPRVAQVTVGIFTFFAGDTDLSAAKELLYNIPEHVLAIVKSDQWKSKIESVHPDRFDKFKRYEFEEDLKQLDYNHLTSLKAALPEGYELHKIDRNWVNESSLHDVSEDFTCQFDSNEDYLKRGIGYCITHKGKVVSGASSYSIFNQGIEIEVDTLEDHRKKGLATVVSAALIIACMDLCIYPNWDAANEASLKLAEKLGYKLKESYDTYYINYKR